MSMEADSQNMGIEGDFYSSNIQISANLDIKF